MSILLTIGFTIFISDSRAEDSATKNTETNSCEFSSADTMWVNQAISAWHYANKTITNLPNIAKFDVLFFDANCQRMSSDALIKPGSITWTSERHKNTVQFPNGGGNLNKAEAIKSFRLRGKWWSQKLSFALFMAVDRLSDNWKSDAFGNGNRTVLTLLDDALLKT